MQHTDFNQLFQRRKTNSLKWDDLEKRFGSDDILPLWVADMDFAAPLEVQSAIQERAAHGIFGYTIRGDSYTEAIVQWLQKRHGWQVHPEQLIHCPGVVPSLAIAIQECTQPKDSILIQSPVYHPFFDVVKQNGRVLIDSPLVFDGSKYRMDFADLERQFASGVALMILCSPHNPVGRVWTRPELEELAALCLAYDVTIVADEIWSDIVLDGHQHIPLATVIDNPALKVITCMAPSKTFNLAGLNTSFSVIAQRQLRNAFAKGLHKLEMHLGNVFGIVGTQAAYEHGHAWLNQAIAYIQDNLVFLNDYLMKRIPVVKIVQPEGTYLVWLDCRELPLAFKDQTSFFAEQAMVGLNDGQFFGPSGAGFQRINIACPQQILAEGLARIDKAVKSL